MKVIVCGGRDFRDRARVWAALDLLHAELGFSALVQGGAQGVDEFARAWAATKPGIQRYVCRAEWDKYGRSAGPKRNARMLEWRPDVVVAFPGGRGTADMVRQALDAGVAVRRIYPDSREAFRRFTAAMHTLACEADGGPDYS